MKDRLLKLFNEHFGYDADGVAFSPSRINLIGEHIDYNGGKVFPAAITIGTYGVYKLRNDNKINLYSINLNSNESFNISSFERTFNWSDYIKGMVTELRDYNLIGMDLLVCGNIPNGSGLSSSASLEMLFGYLQNYLANDNKISGTDIAIFGMNTENNYIGVNSGIMDQFAIYMGKKENAIALNTHTYEYNYYPVNFEDASFVVLNTNKRRTLIDSKYNERVKECSLALNELKNIYDIYSLCDIKSYELENIKKIIKSDVVFRRCRHVVEENERVEKFISACSNNDIILAGKLLKESHESLKNNYEVTGIHLDTIVDFANKHKGCYGARMTGAGFGGCAIALVNNSYIKDFKKFVVANYSNTLNIEPEIIPVHIGNGPHMI